MHTLAHLQDQWDEEARVRAAIDRARAAMAAAARLSRLAWLAVPAAWYFVDRIIAGGVAAAWGVTS